MALTLRQLAMALVEKLDALEAAAAGAAGNEAGAAATTAAGARAPPAAAITADVQPVVKAGSGEVSGEVRQQPRIGHDDDSLLEELGLEGGAAPPAAHVVAGGVTVRVTAATAPAMAGSPPKAAAAASYPGGGLIIPGGGAGAGNAGDADDDPDAIYAADDAAAAVADDAYFGCGAGCAKVASLDDVLILPQHTQVVPGAAAGQQHQGHIGGASLPPSLNDMSPLDLACETKDVDFVSTSVVQVRVQSAGTALEASEGTTDNRARIVGGAAAGCFGCVLCAWACRHMGALAIVATLPHAQGYLQRWWVGVDYTATALQVTMAFGGWEHMTGWAVGLACHKQYASTHIQAFNLCLAHLQPHLPCRTTARCSATSTTTWCCASCRTRASWAAWACWRSGACDRGRARRRGGRRVVSCCAVLVLLAAA